ncbi:MAG: sensor histidine kinase [Luteimonas sp.]
MTSFFFIVRIAIAWLLLLLLLVIVWNSVGGNGLPGFIVLAAFILIGFMVTSALSHVGRVRAIADRVDKATLGSRQRRQIEIPLDAGEAFDLVEAALRELPRSEDIESARDSLQIRAHVRRADRYTRAQRRWGMDTMSWFDDGRNQITATIAPSENGSSATLMCEPERPGWTDWFRVDEGSNLENAEAVSRAITRRLGQRRRDEQLAAQQTSTEKELTVAKLSLLHAQVEPHFLYNTLASAQLLTRSDPPRADDMLGHLIAYLRHSLPRTDASASTLGAELERARAYLEILKIRMGERLALQIDVAATLLALPFPPMMLQTLVENAIKHGLEAKPGGGTIWILAKTDAHADAPTGAQTLSVTVADDGHGFNAGSSGTGIGLRNVRERLRLAYGDAASFVIGANFPAGVAATIRVPVTAGKPTITGTAA